jgi:hypothetical protein
MTVRSKKACVVYQAQTGDICHVHRVLTFDGGREPNESEIAADALRAFQGLQPGRQGTFETLHVDHAAVEPGKKYRVDLQKKALVPQS